MKRLGCFIGVSAMMLAVASGCATDDFPTAPPGGGGGTAVSFSTDIQEIFDRRGCSVASCHGSSQSAGLDLRMGNAHASLVNVMSSQIAIVLVVPNKADSSFLVHKLEGTQSFGSQMPLGAAALNSVDLQNIKDWINDGAPDN